MTKRTPKINGHGLVHCAACDRWLDRDMFGYPPSLKGRPTSYCHDCNAKIDRVRWRGERRAKSNARRLVLQRQSQQAARLERIGTVKGAIETLGRRGFTPTEIAKLAGTTYTTMRKWQDGVHAPSTPAVKRFVLLLRETAHLPIVGKPIARRRLPHPAFAETLERVRPKVVAFPLRSRWKDKAA